MYGTIWRGAKQQWQESQCEGRRLTVLVLVFDRGLW